MVITTKKKRNNIENYIIKKKSKIQENYRFHV